MPAMGTGYATLDRDNGPVSPRPQTAIEGARELISQTCSHIRNITDRVSALANQMNGGRPPEKSTGSVALSGTGSLFNTVDELQASVVTLDKEVSRLDSMG